MKLYKKFHENCSTEELLCYLNRVRLAIKFTVEQIRTELTAFLINTLCINWMQLCIVYNAIYNTVNKCDELCSDHQICYKY